MAIVARNAPTTVSAMQPARRLAEPTCAFSIRKDAQEAVTNVVSVCPIHNRIFLSIPGTLPSTQVTCLAERGG